MTTHLALLRGINVSGHNMIKMDALQKMLESMGFTKVVTYIQSGNVFVTTEEENAATVGFKIKQEIFKVFGYDVPTIVIGQNDLENCLVKNPFLKEKEVDHKNFNASCLVKNLLNKPSVSLKGSISINSSSLSILYSLSFK